VKAIAIIGAGPAGSTAAEKLARGGARVTVFEEKLGWEKPCGGGLPAKVLRRYSFLLETAGGPRRILDAEFVVPNGAVARFRLREPLVVYSRSTLNQLLLARAERVGAEVVQDRIANLAPTSRGWRLQGRGGAYGCDYVILATGARTRLRALLAEDFGARDFMLTFGYYVPGADQVLRVQFFEDFEGYAWGFPRPDHISVGICGKVGENRMPELRERLHGFMRAFGYSSRDAAVFSHLLPALRVESWSNQRLAGPGWALAGDAAGLVDPVTGEGIYYAMRSGDLLADCLLENAPSAYPQRVWKEFGADLAHAARLCTLFYHGDFWGGPVTTRLVEFCGRSGTFVALLQDLMEGRQSYTALDKRLYAGLAASLLEIAASSLRGALPRLRSAEI
jgi:geranylgeranyl reductase family protein